MPFIISAAHLSSVRPKLIKQVRQLQRCKALIAPLLTYLDAPTTPKQPQEVRALRKQLIHLQVCTAMILSDLQSVVETLPKQSDTDIALQVWDLRRPSVASMLQAIHTVPPDLKGDHRSFSMFEYLPYVLQAYADLYFKLLAVMPTQELPMTLQRHANRVASRMIRHKFGCASNTPYCEV